MFSALALVAASTLAFADDYSITVNSLGIGNTWSKGHVTPLHVRVSTTTTKATQAWIQWEVPDADGTLVYHIDLNNFINTGNRSNFIKIKPNDTIIVPQKLSNYFLTQAGTISTIFSLVTIYLQLQNLAGS